MAPEDARIGAVLDNRYRIVSHIATGSMGAIYRGERLKLGRAVAIKVLHTPLANQEAFIQRFEVEAKALSRLGHPNCVSIIDFGIADAPYLVMEFVHGRTLKEVLDQRPLDAPRALHIFRQILAALAHAHGHGIVHRDVKPGNVMLTEATGTGDHIRILDFGLARLHNAALAPDETGSAKVTGTPAYMSPEQAQGKQGDVRSDIYSAGVMLYEMLTGTKPFDTEEMMEVLQMHVEHPPPPLRTAAGGKKFSTALEAVVLKAMHKNPRKRFQTALEFVDAVAGTPEASLPRFHTGSPTYTTAITRLMQPQTPRRWPLVLGVVCLAAVAGAVLWFFGPIGDLYRSSSTTARDARAPEPDQTAIGSVEAAEADGFAPEHVAQDVDPDAEAPEPVVDAGSSDVDPPADARVPPDAKAQRPPSASATGGFAKINALMKAGRRDEAIKQLQKLRWKRPKNAHVDYLLGRLYFEKRWWTEGLKAYRSALKKNRALRGRRQLNLDVITSLTSKKTAYRAERLILQDLRKACLPYLNKTARKHPSKEMRRKAARLISRIR